MVARRMAAEQERFQRAALKGANIARLAYLVAPCACPRGPSEGTIAPKILKTDFLQSAKINANLMENSTAKTTFKIL